MVNLCYADCRLVFSVFLSVVKSLGWNPDQARQERMRSSLGQIMYSFRFVLLRAVLVADPQARTHTSLLSGRVNFIIK